MEAAGTTMTGATEVMAAVTTAEAMEATEAMVATVVTEDTGATTTGTVDLMAVATMVGMEEAMGLTEVATADMAVVDITSMAMEAFMMTTALTIELDRIVPITAAGAIEISKF